ncbi:transmembrane protein 268 [Micromonospora sp. NBC_00898]|uniref:hypothetical protein n=1 Tax=Micromonospora sp. NBC_00898 TaxID=2975981 RepID=UPI0038661E92|nr:transmembrane protein 268 [Micromonospora sp. NBC_00898]
MTARRGGSAGGTQRDPGGYSTQMFLFFSNRIGCLGSILISAILTVILLLIFSR